MLIVAVHSKKKNNSLHTCHDHVPPHARSNCKAHKLGVVVLWLHLIKEHNEHNRTWDEHNRKLPWRNRDFSEHRSIA